MGTAKNTLAHVILLAALAAVAENVDQFPSRWKLPALLAISFTQAMLRPPSLNALRLRRRKPTVSECDEEQ